MNRVLSIIKRKPEWLNNEGEEKAECNDKLPDDLEFIIRENDEIIILFDFS
jgi:hypothetical protein